MSGSKILKVGIVGLGNRSTSWISSFNMVKRARITALCDKFPALVQLRLAQAQSLESRIACFTDFDKMLREADIDAVSLVVAPEDNVELICRALAAGKHVIAEVPLSFKIEECWRAVLAVEKSGGLKFQLGEQVRFSAFARAWKKMVSEGTLGKILYVEGQYVHGPGPDRYWNDAVTGERVDYREASKRKVIKSRLWNMRHPLFYLPHELSPLLSILDDRVVKVTGMGTRPQSYRYDWYDHPDIEVALMHTEKDTILRLMAGFTVATLEGSHHANRMIGVKGWVEQGRTDSEKGKMWLADSFMADKADMTWAFKDYWEAPAEAL
ncbi:MAG: Gfo/Idh/MocA family oxidoreductase, partial [Lentisphaerae bacterium]|nr:Gfo/Idh/MocA family oxidoreductase [Lentisphaerota bacterium]